MNEQNGLLFAASSVVVFDHLSLRIFRRVAFIVPWMSEGCFYVCIYVRGFTSFLNVKLCFNIKCVGFKLLL